MEASVEISMYPLDKEYKTYIKEFIANIRKNPKLTIETNGMSTQVFGDYFEIMSCLSKEIHNSFVKAGTSVFVLKIVNAFLKN